MPPEVLRGSTGFEETTVWTIVPLLLLVALLEPLNFEQTLVWIIGRGGVWRGILWTRWWCWRKEAACSDGCRVAARDAIGDARTEEMEGRTCD